MGKTSAAVKNKWNANAYDRIAVVQRNALSRTLCPHGDWIKHKKDPDFDLATFSKSIGHSSIRTTMEIYAHLDMTQNRFIQRSLEDLKDF